MSKIDKFKSGTVFFQFSKDVPYLTSQEVDKDGKFTGKPIEKLKDEPLFKKETRKRLDVVTAGRLSRNGYGHILNEKYDKVNTAEIATVKK